MASDVDYMTIALQEAELAFAEDEVPVGAVVVDAEGNIVAQAHNTAEHGANAMEHAEVKVLREASDKIGQKRLWDCSLYVTLEPCPMCVAAISMMRLKKIVFGAENPKGGAVVNGIKFFQAETTHFTPEIVSGVMADNCGALLRQFFKKKRS